MLFDLHNEVPHFRATFWVLEAECVIHTVRFGPDDKRICGNELSDMDRTPGKDSQSRADLAVVGKRH